MERFIFQSLAIICLASGLAQPVRAQTAAPVRIAFDREAKRIDLRTGKTIPETAAVRRGSIRFYLNRLDTPDEFINYYHDGLRKANIDDLESMEKVQGKFAIWRLRYKSGSKNTPRVQHQAVSFVPLDDSGRPGERVYLRLDDLVLIDLGE